MERGTGRGILEVTGLSKTFTGQRALHGFDLLLHSGEVHALLGHNGSGKSTFIKILAGYYQPDPGAKAWLNGSEFELGSPSQARTGGLRFIHQDLGLVSELSIVDNLALGSVYESTWWVGGKRDESAASDLLENYGIKLNVRRKLRDLGPAEQTMVAIARALRGDTAEGRVLVLDEPTASLPAAEVERVFEVVNTIKQAGGCVLYVTHRLGEVHELADTVSVLRNGELAATRATSEVTRDDLVDLIVGRTLDTSVSEARTKSEATKVAGDRQASLFRVQDLVGRTVRGVSFDVEAGEILGVGGIVGSGREELPHLLFGSHSWTGGSVQVNGRTITAMSPRTAVAARMGFVPSDRKGLGSTPSLSIADNLLLPKLPRHRVSRWLSNRTVDRESKAWLSQFGVRTPSLRSALSTLSGGNQQRVVLARWIRCAPLILLVDEPTQGVDVGAKADIYAIVRTAASKGMSVVVFSSDAEELAGLCDRVLVLSEGRVRTTLQGAELTPDAVVAETVRASERTSV